MTPNNLNLYFGDIHNHNALGYGLGSLERSIDIARTHLDFFAFTGHSSWHDIQPMEGGREQHWYQGFEKLEQAWPKVQQLIAETNHSGTFSTFLGFEWHSSAYGDQCVIFPNDHQPLIYPDSVEELRAFCLQRRALMIPHHIAYPTGRRGVNWDVFDSACTPVVEIFSEHGNAEEDRGAYPFFSHSMGGRVSANTARRGLDRGLQFGFVASSDNHRGFPGAYGEGLLGVWARELSRTALFEAIRNRRTYALTGDRIGLYVEVDGLPMGSKIRTGKQVDVGCEVKGRDEIDVVEVILDGRIVRRDYPAEAASSDVFMVRLEWGWGPWTDLALPRVCDWKFDVSISNGNIQEVFPCLRSGPFDESRRHRFTRIANDTIRVVSYTSRQEAYRHNPNHSLVLQVEGNERTRFDLNLHRPKVQPVSVSFGELAHSSYFIPTGPFPAESCLWHRIVPLSASSLSGRYTLSCTPGHHYAYVRVRQKNGQMAWGSPVFIEC